MPPPKTQAGCTSVVALLVGTELFVANAGDSRAVLSRAGEVSFRGRFCSSGWVNVGVKRNADTPTARIGVCVSTDLTGPPTTTTAIAIGGRPH